ncbi:hypothetical protein [Maridesulfovibrio frigidus]|uniref:hypothetical protein n=1 Tax=Maridesulfovibrio frigidus TaxID=340956 RepID=UPI0004E1975D|nr:hypothetical protein [Maridesulfovibrio frigidus]
MCLHVIFHRTVTFEATCTYCGAHEWLTTEKAVTKFTKDHADCNKLYEAEYEQSLCELRIGENTEATSRIAPTHDEQRHV